MPRKSKKDQLIDQINYRIKALSQKGLSAFAEVGSNLVKAKTKFGASLTKGSLISKKSKSTTKQLESILKAIPSLSKVNIQLDRSRKKEEKLLGHKVSRKKFREQVAHVATGFENLPSLYSDLTADQMDQFRQDLKGELSYEDLDRILTEYEEMARNN